MRFERKSLSGLSSDLNWLRRGGTPAPAGPKSEQIPVKDRLPFFVAWKSSEWHMLLHQSRITAFLFDPFALATTRAMAWEKIGQPSIARIFYDFASQLKPGDGGAALGALRNLMKEDSVRGRAKVEAVLQDDFRYPTLVVVFSTFFQLHRLSQENKPFDHSSYADRLRRSLDQMQYEDLSDAEKVETYRFAGFGFELLNEFRRVPTLL